MIRVSLEGDCTQSPDCRPFAERIARQLSGGYGHRASILPVPADIEDWRAAHPTARRRASRAARLGYGFDEILRSEHELAVFSINTSLPERQGRPMAPAYAEPHHFNDPDPWPCLRHRVYPYGVLDRNGILVAYLWLYRLGELAMVSSILGHGCHLDHDVMYLLVAGALAAQESLEGWCFYNRHDSGTGGLRYFKERLGFGPTEVEFIL